jgi:hypothetical protein
MQTVLSCAVGKTPAQATRSFIAVRHHTFVVIITNLHKTQEMNQPQIIFSKQRVTKIWVCQLTITANVVWTKFQTQDTSIAALNTPTLEEMVEVFLRKLDVSLCLAIRKIRTVTKEGKIASSRVESTRKQNAIQEMHGTTESFMFGVTMPVIIPLAYVPITQRQVPSWESLRQVHLNVLSQ